MTEGEALRILHLEAGCSAAQVRQAYRDLVKVWHPDRFQGDGRLAARAERTLQDINEAYGILEGGTTRPSGPIGTGAPVAAQPPSASGQSFSANSTRDQVKRSRLRFARIVAAALGLGVLAGGGATMSVFMTRGESATSAATQSTVASDVRTGKTVSRPQSGVELLPPRQTGGGALAIYNESRRDAVIALAAQDGHERAVYVRAGEQVTLANVATGTYRVQMMVGRDWASDRFLRDATYQELDQPVQFVERTDGTAIEYTKLTVNLQPVASRLQGIRQTRPFRITHR